MIKILNIHYALLLVFLLASCKSIQSTQTDRNINLPNSYHTNLDTTNIADISWKEYFNDSILVSLIEEGIHNNYDVMIALQRIEQTRSAVIFRKGLLLPTVYAGGSAAVRRYGLYTMDGAGNSTTDILPGQIVPANLPDYLLGLQASWEADITGKLRNRKKAATARYLAGLEGRNWIITNLAAEIASAYYNLLALDFELEIIRNNIQIQENAFSVVTIQKENGAANELAVMQFQAQLLNTQSLENEVLQLIKETENQINTLLGRMPQPIIRNKEIFNREINSNYPYGIPSQLLNNRPDVKQAELELIASQADLKAAKAAFYPSLYINGSVGFQAFKSSLLFTSPESFIFTLVGNLWAPLLNRSAIKAEFNAANAYQVEALYNYHKSIVLAYTEVNNEISNFNNLSQIVKRKTLEVDVLSKSKTTSIELYKSGRATYLEVLLAQQNALQARLEMINVKKRQLNSTITLYRVLGGGWK
jgi:outer membrane protein, multidrug efflux system